MLTANHVVAVVTGGYFTIYAQHVLVELGYRGGGNAHLWLELLEADGDG